MIFMLELIPPDQSLIAYESQSFFETCLKFFSSLNDWAVMDVEEDDEGYERKRYDSDAAIATEMHLM